MEWNEVQTLEKLRASFQALIQALANDQDQVGPQNSEIEVLFSISRRPSHTRQSPGPSRMAGKIAGFPVNANTSALLFNHGITQC